VREKRFWGGGGRPAGHGFQIGGTARRHLDPRATKNSFVRAARRTSRRRGTAGSPGPACRRAGRGDHPRFSAHVWHGRLVRPWESSAVLRPRVARPACPAVGIIGGAPPRPDEPAVPHVRARAVPHTLNRHRAGENPQNVNLGNLTKTVNDFELFRRKKFPKDFPTISCRQSAKRCAIITCAIKAKWRRNSSPSPHAADTSGESEDYPEAP